MKTDISDAAGNLAAYRKECVASTSSAIANLNIFARYADAPPIAVATGLHHNSVISLKEGAVFYENAFA
jgi:hypothetical protein